MADNSTTDKPADTGAAAQQTELESKMSPADAKFLATMFRYLPGPPLDMNWEAFAAEMGLKNANVAKVRCRQIRAKLGITGPANANATANGKGNGDGDDNGGAPPVLTTPTKTNPTEGKITKKARKTPAKAKTAKKAPSPQPEEEVAGDDDQN